ncbi:MAG: helix-turn-helix transcriptional regulator [Dehalococcoidia bacterium]
MPLNRESAIKLGATLKAARLKKGWTVRQLVEQSGAYLSASYMSHVESGRQMPALRSLRLLANALGLDVAQSLADSGCDENDYHSVTFNSPAKGQPAPPARVDAPFKGAADAIRGAREAEARYDWEMAGALWGAAVQTTSPSNPQRLEMQQRRALALAAAGHFEEAGRLGLEVIPLIADEQGPQAAVAFAGDLVEEVHSAGGKEISWEIAEFGLEYAGDVRDGAWVRLKMDDLEHRDAERTSSVGLVIDTPERREVYSVLATLPLEEQRRISNMGHVLPLDATRETVLSDFGDFPLLTTSFAGELAASLPLWEEEAHVCETENRHQRLASIHAQIARCHNALGDFKAAELALGRAIALGQHFKPSTDATMAIASALYEMRYATGDGWTDLAAAADGFLPGAGSEGNWTMATVQAVSAHVYAQVGRKAEARELLKGIVPAIAQGRGWSPFYTMLVGAAVDAVWALGPPVPRKLAAALRVSLERKIMPQDFRAPMMDSSRALGQLLCLSGQPDGAHEWFVFARKVLDEQRARPLRALVDFNEAQMWSCVAGSEGRSQILADAALRQFEELGMKGWSQKTERLLHGEGATF